MKNLFACFKAFQNPSLQNGKCFAFLYVFFPNIKIWLSDSACYSLKIEKNEFSTTNKILFILFIYLFIFVVDFSMCDSENSKKLFTDLVKKDFLFFSGQNVCQNIN